MSEEPSDIIQEPNEVEEQEHQSDHNEEEVPDQGPHLVTSVPENKKKERAPKRTGRKRTRQTPYDRERKTESDHLNTETGSEPQFKKIRSVRKKLIPPEEDQKTQDLRKELKFLILNNAKLNGLNSESELKRELNRAARLKPSDLAFELDKMRLITDRAWTRDLARCIRDGTGIALDIMTKSQGHVAKEFKEDAQLEAALHDRLKKVAAFMNPNIRIGLLAGKDLAFGYWKRRTNSNISNSNSNSVEENIAPPLLVRQNAYTILPEVNT